MPQDSHPVECGSQRGLTWRGLSQEEQCVLFSAAEQANFVVVLANWEPGSDWNGKRQHVARLSAATECLLKAGLIEIYEQHIGPGEDALLLRDDAIEIARNEDNWWREETGEDDGSGHTYYSLLITDKGVEVMKTLGNGNLYGYLDH